MKKNLLLVFLIIIFMPIIVITVMAVISYRDNAKQNSEMLREKAYELLLSNDRLIQNRIRLLEGELDEMTLNSRQPIEELRKNMNRERMIRQAFIMDQSDLFLYPSPKGDLSRREQEFLNEASDIELTENLRSHISPGEKEISQSRWYTWFMGDGLNFIYYREREEEITGFLIERYALIAEIINVLPQTESHDDQFQIQMTDARGNVLYQWGNYKPEKEAAPLIEYSLSGTLSSWRLFYYHNESLSGNEEGALRTFFIISGLALLTIVIFFLALYFYRESAREMETARKQVSFVNQVSHELKTPLTNIRLYSELLQNRMTAEKDRDYTEIIINESHRLGRMINNVLTFSRSERGELRIKRETVHINRLIRDVLEKFDLLIGNNAMETEFREIDLPPVQTDRDMIEQILINLIGNALKYGAEGHYLGIITEREKEYILIYIKDKGPGISAAEKDKIFKPFYRIDSSLTQKNSGTGIGLSIASTLAKETNSLLRLEKSTEGACFSLSIPLGEIEK